VRLQQVEETLAGEDELQDGGSAAPNSWRNEPKYCASVYRYLFLKNLQKKMNF
jgi:hypothetical protein